ncbi:MAG: glutathione S-transferase family protein [Stappiaceae bacterium]
METLEIIGFPQSSYTFATRIAAHEKGVDYELIPAAPHSEEVIAVNPIGKIPAMRHGSVKLGESEAIVRYIDRIGSGPALFPGEVNAAANADMWISYTNTEIDRCCIRNYVLQYIFPAGPEGAPDREKIDASVQEMKEKHFPRLEAALASSEYLAGASPSFADFNMVPILFYTNQMPEGAELIKASPKISAYLDRMMARKSVQDAIPPKPE